MISNLKGLIFTERMVQNLSAKINTISTYDKILDLLLEKGEIFLHKSTEPFNKICACVSVNSF